MSQDAIAQIVSAEEQAEVLCRVATERAAEMRAKAKQEGEAYLARVEREATEEYAEKLREVRTGAQALEQSRRKAAEERAAALERAAMERMDEAVRQIVWGIVEKCQ